MDYLLNNNAFLLTIIIAMPGLLIILLVFVIVNHITITKLKRKYDFFMRNTTDGLTIEDLLHELIEETRKCTSNQQSIENNLTNLNKQFRTCFQKFGVVRYNPFEDTGGDLSYVIAILDCSNSGFLLNGIYNRDGSYTYAKLIENGQCNKYKLSNEEAEALNIAINSK